MNRLCTEPWVQSVRESVPAYLARLARPGRPGSFFPCERGRTALGSAAGLGFSCFGLKIFYTLRLWETLPQQEQQGWLARIRSFQHGHTFAGDRYRDGAFIDPPVYGCVLRTLPRGTRLLLRLATPRRLTEVQRLLLAETKQAIATLAQVGARPDRPYRGFPLSARGLRDFWEQLDWAQPWAAGGQAACCAVMLATQAPSLCGEAASRQLRMLWSALCDSLADRNTGGYFRGRAPAAGQLVNGAMKILTGLDWLNLPVHYPEALIDTYLATTPPTEACYIVNTVYVLHRCLQQTAYKRGAVQDYCRDLAGLIRRFFNPDGGFSYAVGRSQRFYYGAPIAAGLPESDIHGTCLLVWALAMIITILEEDDGGWRVIKP